MYKTLALLFAVAAGTASLAARVPKGGRSIKPRVHAHRGTSATAPENTLAAFRLAVELGADAIELDTTLSSDGVPVVIHDAKVDRTTNGKGNVEAMPLSEIRKLDAGSWKGPQFKGEPLPTLEEVFRMRRRPFINIELKANPAAVDPLADAVVKLIERFRLEKKVIVSSFSIQALERVHARNPRIATGYLYSGPTPATLPTGITSLHPFSSQVNEVSMGLARSKGLQVNVWTVDDPTEMRRLIALGVDGIITNVPALAREVIAGG